MPISRYPRPGHPISPSILAPLLIGKSSKAGVGLSELDANCWERFGESVCRELGKVVVEHLYPQRDEILIQFGTCKIAPPGSTLKRCNLPLELRTYNCLGSIKVDERLDGLAGITIREVLRIRSFGIRSLVDFLTSIEGVVGTSSSEAELVPLTPDTLQNGVSLLETCDVIRRSGFLPSTMAKVKIPRPPKGVKLAEMGLRARTSNALKKAGYSRDPAKLGDLTFRQAIQIPNFGMESLYDLIAAIQRVERVRYPLFTRGSVRGDEARALLELLKDAKTIPECVLKSYIPPLPPGTYIDEIGLQRRTLNVLAREGFVDSSERLSQTKIAGLCKFHGFGVTSLVDLLESVCRIRESSDYCEPATKSVLRDVEETLARICAVPNATEIGQADPRLGRYLRRLDSGAANIAELSDRSKHLAILGRTDEVKKLAEEIERCRSLTIESELIDIVGGKQASERNRKVISEYYGFGGGPLVTLELLGDRYNITRERIRQICAPSKVAKLPSPPFAPMLDAALNLVRDSTPCMKSDLERDLRNQQLIQDRTTIDSLKRVASFLRRETDVEYIGATHSSFVLPKTVADQLPMIEQTARRVVSKFGAAMIDDVLERCDITISDRQAEQLMTAVVGSMKGFRWLDISTGWFWFDSISNRLTRRIRKVLSICERINVGELRGAIRRDNRLNGRVPPKRILIEICRQIPKVVVKGQDVFSLANDDTREMIRGDEAILVNLLQQYGPVCRREELQSHAFGAGVSRPSFWRCLQFCPTISHYGPSVYGLTAAAIQPGVIESMTGVRHSSQVVQDHGWTADGNIWIGYRISQAAIESGVIGVPAAKREYLQGQFSLKTERLANIGTISVKKACVCGLGPYFRLSGVEEGDFLVMLFQLSPRTISLAIGDEGLLEQYQEAM